ncbi:hypothetical protein L484_017052 [Morus notabilis]|uniref:Uncharacterized protein n=1 Tax=Morus notabilis TaxID=981085 RepID=W9RUA0_9ROSA|nr:hypothetical protein L484_017052 [Morus notabilis]
MNQQSHVEKQPATIRNIRYTIYGKSPPNLYFSLNKGIQSVYRLCRIMTLPISLHIIVNISHTDPVDNPQPPRLTSQGHLGVSG